LITWLAILYFSIHSCSLKTRAAPVLAVGLQAHSGEIDVLADGEIVGRIFKAAASPVGTPWMWTLAFGYHRDRAPNHGYAATREAAMAAFAKSWRRE
jgi:hypothetical protein